VNLYLAPESYVEMCGAGMLSPEGRCKTFDNSADGFVPGEGVGAMVLKRLQDAERDGDSIHGVIIGSGINQDGKTNGITAPSMNSQAALLKTIYSRFAIDPRSISYVEAHGTGTKLGDPIELAALSTAFGEGRGDKQFCALGSVKSNLGHISAAAGVAGVHKVLLCLRHRRLVPSLHFVDPNEHFDFKDSAFYVNTESKPWESIDRSPRRAAVSSFGYSGTNAHLVIEEHITPIKQAGQPVIDDYHPAIIVLSAKTEAQLKIQAANLLGAIQSRSLTNDDLASIAYTLQIGRAAMEERLGILVASFNSLAAKLTDFIEAKALPDGVYRGNAKKDKDALSLFTSDEDLEITLQSWVVKGKYDKLIDLWVKGVTFDWTRIYRDGDNPRRINLPTYPFLKQRCWIDTDDRYTAQYRDRGGAVATANQSASAAPQRRADIEAAIQTLLPFWETCAAAIVKEAAVDSAVLIGGDNPALQEALIAHVPHTQVLSLRLDESVEALITLLRSVGDIDRLIWVLPQDQTDEIESEQNIHQQSIGARFGFRLIKALLGLGYGGKLLRLNVVTWQTQSVRDEVVYPAHSSVHGLIGSLAKEYPNWRIQLADLPIEYNSANQLMADCLSLAADPQGDAIAWRDGQWYRRHLLPIEITYDPPQGAFRQSGVYVVIGGAGGIGEVFSEHLARNYRARIVWLGRRALDDAIGAKLDRLAQFGPKPLYLQADASIRSSLAKAYERIRSEYGSINGIVHSAIVLDDKSFANMDEDRFLAGLSAKVDTSVRLAQVFSKENLDFVLFFSSMQSLMKAPGQSNYAAGCTFSDAFAQRLNQVWKCPVKIINWGYWGNVGIVADKTYQDRMAAIGIGSIEPAEGMAALERLLNTSVRQLALVKGSDVGALVRSAAPAQHRVILAAQTAPVMETIWSE